MPHAGSAGLPARGSADGSTEKQVRSVLVLMPPPKPSSRAASMQSFLVLLISEDRSLTGAHAGHVLLVMLHVPKEASMARAQASCPVSVQDVHQHAWTSATAHARALANIHQCFLA